MPNPQPAIRLNSPDSDRYSSATSRNEALIDAASFARAQSSSVIDDEAASAVDSRNGPAGWGKCTESVKTLVPSEFKGALATHWRGLGYDSEADFVREALMFMVLGRQELERLHLNRIRRLGSDGPAFVPTHGPAEVR